RLTAGQAHLPRTRPACRDPPGPPGAGRVPHPRRADQHRVPDRGARRSRLPGRPGHHLVHRGPPGTACPADLRRPGHQAADLPGRRDGQPPARPPAAAGRPRGEASPGRPRLPTARRVTAAAPRPWPGGVRAGAAPPGGAGSHRHHVPRRAPVAAGHPGTQPGPAGGRRACRAQRAGVAVAGSLGWCHLRRRAERGGAQHLSADAAARPNTVGYTPYPETVTEVFVREAAAAGIDIFRIFDALNDVNQMRAAIDAVRSTGTAVAEVALCYTADLSDPGERLYTLDYYLRLAEQIVGAGAHILAIKDMA